MKLNNPQNPLAKTDGLVVQELPDELLVYDLEKNKAYDLNQTIQKFTPGDENTFKEWYDLSSRKIIHLSQTQQ